MKSLIAFFRHPITIGVIGLIALSVVVWIGLDYVKFGADNRVVSYPVRLLVIAFFVVVWLLNIIRKLWVGRQQNNKMLDDIQVSEKRPEPPRQGQSVEEIKQLDKRFNDAIAVLRKTKFKSGGNSNKNLYQLPWYIIIGPPGAGKTTALVNSGLDFPLAESHGKGALGGIGGTRNCDWWFTDEAVLIDTAGRYTTQDSNRSEDNQAWQGFLKLLKKHRRRQPINGAIIAVSVHDILLQTPQQRAVQASAIRSRVDELHKQLGIEFPIYLLFTKCDLIAGFSDYFTQLTLAEREQVWGITFNAKHEVDPAGQFKLEFEQLTARLGERMLSKVQFERDPQKRALIQNFPAQFGSLQDAIAELIDQVFSDNRYQEQPVFRGVYFSSATQEGMPIDRMMASISANFGFGREASLQQFNAGQSFFIHRLFSDVIFPEAGSVGADVRLEASLRWTRRVFIFLLTVAFAGTLLVWAGSVTRNLQFMKQVRGFASDYQSQRQELLSPDPMQVSSMLEPLRQGSEVYAHDQHPWLSSMGLYDPTVDTAATELYRQAIDQHFLPDLQTAMESQLGDVKKEDEATLFETLRAYLMLGYVDRRDEDSLRRWANNYWATLLPNNIETQQALDNYLTELFEQGFDAPELNHSLIASTRKTLVSTPLPGRLYGQIKADFASHPPLRLKGAVGASTMAVFGIDESNWRAEIPYLYTRPAYHKLDFDADNALLREYEENRWVLGEQFVALESEADRARLRDQVMQLYLDDYNAYWNRAIKSLRLAPFPDLASAEKTLGLLADPLGSPIIAILELTRDNTELSAGSGASEAGADRSVARANKQTIVERDFAALNALLVTADGKPRRVDALIAALAAVRNDVSKIARAANSNEAAFRASQSSGVASIGKANALAAGMPKPVNTWLLETTRYLSSASRAAGRSHLARVWQNDVCGQFDTSLASAFPFSANSLEDTSIDAFNRFFSPAGIEAGFFNKYLAPHIDQRTWQLKDSGNGRISVQPETLQQLEQASVIRAAFFPTGKNHAQIKYQLTPVKLDATVRKFELDMGAGQKPIVYTHGPKFGQAFLWTGESTDQIRILFEDLNGTRHQKEYEGSWALFRLLADSELQETASPGVFELTMRQAGRKARYELKISSRVNPLNMDLLSGFQCAGTL